MAGLAWELWNKRECNMKGKGNEEKIEGWRMKMKEGKALEF